MSDLYFTSNNSQNNNFSLELLDKERLEIKFGFTKTSDNWIKSFSKYFNVLSHYRLIDHFKQLDSDVLDELIKKTFLFNSDNYTITPGMLMFLEYYKAKLELDLSHCYISLSEELSHNIILNELPKLNDTDNSFNIIERRGGHWDLLHIQKDNTGKANIIYIDSLEVGVTRQQALKEFAVQHKLNADIYYNNLHIQNGKGCAIFTLKFLKYVLNNGPEQVLKEVKENVNSVSVLENLTLFSYKLPPECMTLTQSMSVINGNDGYLKNKDKLLSEYVTNPKEAKYGVSTPAYNNGKPQNNKVDYFKAKYIEKALEIIKSYNYDFQKISEIIADYEYNPFEDKDTEVIGEIN